MLERICLLLSHFVFETYSEILLLLRDHEIEVRWWYSPTQGICSYAGISDIGSAQVQEGCQCPGHVLVVQSHPPITIGTSCHLWRCHFRRLSSGRIGDFSRLKLGTPWPFPQAKSQVRSQPISLLYLGADRTGAPCPSAFHICKIISKITIKHNVVILFFGNEKILNKTKASSLLKSCGRSRCGQLPTWSFLLPLGTCRSTAARKRSPSPELLLVRGQG